MKKLTLSDFVSAGICVSGIRDFAKEYNLDFRDFAKNGMTEEQYAQFRGNAFLERALIKMEERK